ncbi:alpha/beta fold hydrolase [Streptomyces racemochromogenes]|uniref:Alpha/beta fold hydrolase n=1 Tax=Streptomyces racemochromogenes TaxID=67353 RepID=A0ABW7PDN0_9ACTN
MSAARGTTADDPWIRRFHPPAAPGTAPVLVVLPHAGGSASFYFPLSRDLAAHAEVLTVQYPGRQDRLGEPSPDTVAGFVDEVQRALEPWRGRSLVLFGHSMGAVLAYELARRLEASGGGAGPRGLVLSGRRSPLVARHDDLHTRDDDALLAHVGALAGTDAGLLADPELRAMVLPALRGDYRAVGTYRHEPGPLLRTPVSVLCGESDPRTSLSEAMAWRELTGAAFTFRAFPGGHFYLAEHHEAVARALADDVAAFTTA